LSSTPRHRDAPPLAPQPAIATAAPAAHGLDARGHLKTGRLAGLSLGAAIFTLSWPVLIDSMLATLVGLTDVYLAARLSAAATDAIGAAAYIGWFVGISIMALDVGATALVSRSIGKGRLATARAAVGQTMVLAIIVGVIMGAALMLLREPLILLMGLSGEAAVDFRIFLRVMSIDVPATAILFGAIAVLRGAGDSRTPMLAMVVVNIVNLAVAVALSGIDLSIPSGTAPDGTPLHRVLWENTLGFDLGVLGIALATLTAHTVGAALLLYALLRGRGGVDLRLKRLRPHRTTLARLARVGIPNYLETLGMFIGNYAIMLMVAWMGAGAGGLLGSHMIAIRLEAISFQPGFAMGVAAAALAGQYLGAGSPRHAARAMLVCAGVASIFMGLMGLVFCLFGRTLVGFMSEQPEHLAKVPTLLFITGLVQIPFAVGIVFRSGMRGAGDVRAIMWLTWISTYAVRLPLAYALSGVAIPLPGAISRWWLGHEGGVIPNPIADLIPLPFGGGLAGLWVALCAEIVIRGALFTWRFVHGGWTRSKV
jgi:Na+-driven multidrug efflux pump